MSMDASLKSASALVRHRNVLTRAERLERLDKDGKWDEKRSILGLPKVANRKMALAKSAPKEAAAEGAAAGAAPAAGAAAAPAAGGKAPAAGAKAAAPAKDAGGAKKK
jgi:small basic protein (TIGR04137 family)